jgi:hypothetical protein
MAVRHLWSFVEQMPIIQARESIMRINEQAYAFGSFSKEDGSTYLRELQIAATGPDKPLAQVAPRPKSPEEMMHLLSTSSKVTGRIEGLDGPESSA